MEWSPEPISSNIPSNPHIWPSRKFHPLITQALFLPALPGSSFYFSAHQETMFMDVILMSPAKSGTTKNLMARAAAGILRSFQNDIRQFPDGH